VLSVNGNVAALAPGETVELAEAVGADIEVNLFNHTDERVRRIADHLREHGADDVKGLAADGDIPGLDHARGTVDADGIEAADVVVVPLEDGDRAEALDAMGKTEIVIDLNPGSRSPRRPTDIPIIDNLIRAVPNVTAHARDLADASSAARRDAIDSFAADAALADAEATIREGPSQHRMTRFRAKRPRETRPADKNSGLPVSELQSPLATNSTHGTRRDGSRDPPNLTGGRPDAVLGGRTPHRHVECDRS